MHTCRNNSSEGQVKSLKLNILYMLKSFAVVLVDDRLEAVNYTETALVSNHMYTGFAVPVAVGSKIFLF